MNSLTHPNFIKGKNTSLKNKIFSKIILNLNLEKKNRKVWNAQHLRPHLLGKVTLHRVIILCVI